MILGHSISTGFRKLTGCQQDPRDRGVTLIASALISSLVVAQHPVATTNDEPIKDVDQ